MGRTAPDWSSYGRLERLLAQYDIAELAARISNYLSPHREGKWLYRDGFEDGASDWEFAGTGTDNYQGLTVAHAKIGGVSVELTTGNVTDDWAYAGRFYSHPLSGHCGFEIAFSKNTIKAYISLEILFYAGGWVYHFGVRIDNDLNTMQRMDSDGNWVAFETDTYIEDSHIGWNNLKLVVDLDSKKYERVFLNGTEYDLTATQTGTTGEVPRAWLDVLTRVVTKRDNNATVYLDEVVVTEAERGWQ